MNCISSAAGETNTAVSKPVRIELNYKDYDFSLYSSATVLSAQEKKGIARNVYDRFCKEYRNSMGEDYKILFADL